MAKTRQWIDKIESPLTTKERLVLESIDGLDSYQEVHDITGISSNHSNNIITKLKKRGLIEKVWRRTPYRGSGVEIIPIRTFHNLKYIVESDKLPLRDDSLEDVLEWIGGDIAKLEFLIDYVKKTTAIAIQEPISEKLSELIELAKEKANALPDRNNP